MKTREQISRQLAKLAQIRRFGECTQKYFDRHHARLLDELDTLTTKDN